MSTDDLDNMPRMLPPSEIESLRRDKEEAGAWLMQQMKKDQLPDQSEPRMLTKAKSSYFGKINRSWRGR